MIRDFDPGDYPSLPEITNAVYPDLVATVEDYTAQDKERDEKIRHRRWIAEVNDKVVGTGLYTQDLYQYDPHHFFLWIIVHPNFLGKGIGSALYDAISQAAEEFQPRQWKSMTRSDRPDSISWLETRAFRKYERSGESHLDVNSCDLTPYARLEADLARDGIVIKTVSELESDPDRNQKLHELDWEVARDVPGSEEFTPITLEQYQRDTIYHSLTPQKGCFIAVDGNRFVGMCHLRLERGDNSLFHGLTGVVRSHRRRKIALTLKVKTIQYAQANGRSPIKTSNHVDNRPMLSINERLGFVRQPDWIYFRKQVDTIIA